MFGFHSYISFLVWNHFLFLVQSTDIEKLVNNAKCYYYY